MRNWMSQTGQRVRLGPRRKMKMRRKTVMKMMTKTVRTVRRKKPKKQRRRKLRRIAMNRLYRINILYTSFEDSGQGSVCHFLLKKLLDA